MNNPKKHVENNQHYDEVSEAWRSIFGDNFHWGLFLDSNDSLEIATFNLIEKMASFANLVSSDNVVDIGCGIGEPARYLNEKYGCTVKGISNSVVGVELANSKNRTEFVRFEVADALDSKLPNKFYDVAWLLEMSHLIEDKASLIKEACRSLKPGGRLVLCDLTLKASLSAKEVVSIMKELKLLEFSFGKASLITLEHYKKIFETCGLEKIEVEDISEEVIPTIAGWVKNCEEKKAEIISASSKEHYRNFIESCDILRNFYKNKKWGYGVIVGSKKI